MINRHLHRRKSGKGLTYSSPTDPLLKKGIINTIELLSGRRLIHKKYRELESLNLSGLELWNEIINKLDVWLDIDTSQVNKIPQDGPLLVIANHPFGVLDGLILGHIIAQKRLDFKILVNEVLTREKMINEYLLPIDFRETKEAMAINISTRKQSMDCLSDGGCVAIFPSGGVATIPKIVDRKAEDLEWKRFVIKILTKAKATVLPVFFHGQNSRMFQVASHVHPNIRLALLMHEVKNKLGKAIKIDIHDPIPFEDLPSDLNRQELLNYLKSKTFGENIVNA